MWRHRSNLDYRPVFVHNSYSIVNRNEVGVRRFVRAGNRTLGTEKRCVFFEEEFQEPSAEVEFLPLGTSEFTFSRIYKKCGEHCNFQTTKYREKKEHVIVETSHSEIRDEKTSRKNIVTRTHRKDTTREVGKSISWFTWSIKMSAVNMHSIHTPTTYVNIKKYWRRK